MIVFKASRVNAKFASTVKMIDDMSKRMDEVCKIEVSSDAEFIKYA